MILSTIVISATFLFLIYTIIENKIRIKNNEKLIRNLKKFENE